MKNNGGIKEFFREFTTDFNAVIVGGDVCATFALAYSGTMSRFSLFTACNHPNKVKTRLFATSKIQTLKSNIRYSQLNTD